MSPLEKAAKALWDWNEKRLRSHIPWDSADEQAGKGVCRDEVRVILAALRPGPSDMERVRAVARKMLHTSPGEVDLIVCAYIDAALEEK